MFIGRTAAGFAAPLVATDEALPPSFRDGRPIFIGRTAAGFAAPLVATNEAAASLYSR